MRVASDKDFDNAYNSIEKTQQDTMGDRVARTRRKLKEQGFTHYKKMMGIKEL